MSGDAERSAQESSLEVLLVDLDRVLPTEEVDPVFVETLVAGMKAAGVWTHPLLVESGSYAVLDGHHRLAAARSLGLCSVPAVCVGYADPKVHLESWRPGLRFTPEEVLERARSGRLLPYKSTRHVTDFVLPQVRVPLAALQRAAVHGRPVASAGRHPTRTMMLAPAYHRFCSRMRVRPDAAGKLEIETPETQAPHAQLRRDLQADPAMAALLPVAPGRLVLGSSLDSPFFLKRTGLLNLPPSLLSNPPALALATRWGLEASHLQASGLLSPRSLAGIVRHGKSLLRTASVETCDALLEGMPDRIRDELLDRAAGAPSAAVVAWQATRIESLARMPMAAAPQDGAACELWHCVEELMVSGGDSRIAIEPRTGFNRYGTAPRPRPEAVHFSSSTASSVSDYGFTYCDLARRDLLAAMLREDLAEAALHARMVDATAAELVDLLTLGESEADVALAPSGTDTELLVVALARAAGGALTNIVIAPEETGRGVREAAAGRYFDGIAGSGQSVRKGQPAWPGAVIRLAEVPIRDGAGRPRSRGQVAADARGQVLRALERGDRVLLHYLASSKSGLASPGEEAIREIAALAPAAIDVVVDACQMRSPFAKMGEWVRHGWLVQVSGSKFLTGPPFSGALLVPTALRDRSAAAGALLAEAPAVGPPRYWSGWWRERLEAAPVSDASFGPVFRWLPALLEAKLFNAIPLGIKESSFERFRSALNRRLEQSAWLVRAETLDGQGPRSDGIADLATSSIICFSVMVSHWDGSRRALGEEECRRIFRLLNLDLGQELGQLSPAERARAQLQAHIGQPLVLGSQGSAGGAAMLRMVLGARFFSIVAHAGPGSVEAALESEIADAVRALEKLELLAQMWSKVQHIALA
jgi:hypothetical protein